MWDTIEEVLEQARRRLAEVQAETGAAPDDEALIETAVAMRGLTAHDEAVWLTIALRLGELLETRKELSELRATMKRLCRQIELGALLAMVPAHLELEVEGVDGDAPDYVAWWIRADGPRVHRGGDPNRPVHGSGPTREAAIRAATMKLLEHLGVYTEPADPQLPGVTRPAPNVVRSEGDDDG